MSPAASPPVLTQDPREYTVQVFDRNTLRILGSGVVLSPDGLVATCLHVADACSQQAGQGRYDGLGVRFPETDTRSATSHRACPTGDLGGYEDDLICLRVFDPPLLDERHIAVAGAAEGSDRHRFISYGYRPLARLIAARAEGRILGSVEPPPGVRMRCDPVQLQSQHVNYGMSGAGVLDVERNLVVGLISDAWTSAGAFADRDTAFAVNARVVEFTGLGIEVSRSRHPLAAADRPAYSEPLPVRGGASVVLDQAPLLFPEWVGRDALVNSLCEAWDQEGRRVIGLIGFGGEGKTSVARRVVDALVETGGCPSVFWWTFGEAAGPDAFFSAALDYRLKALAKFIAPADRAEALASTLPEDRVLFVLDGLEVLQRQEGDGYGTITDRDLRAFLQFFAAPGHSSLCIVTSRAPVFDLQAYVTYRHVDVDALSGTAARSLLRKLGVKGSDAEVDRICADWGRHALTLSLLAGYLVRRFDGEARRVSALPAPDPNDERDARVERILREYDKYLDEDEKAFLTAFSVYRTPVEPEALAPALALRPGPRTPRRSSTDLLEHLLTSRIVQAEETGLSVMHPLVRDHYSRLGTPQVRAALHESAKHHYSQHMDAIPERPTLEDLTPAIEAAHHACMSGSFEEAADVIMTRLYQGQRGLITRELNAYSTVLSALLDFFPDHQLRATPAGEPETRSWLYAETAFALQMLGRFDESAMLMRRAIDDFRAHGAWHDAAVACQNLTELYLDRGAFTAARQLIDQAFGLARRAEDPEDDLVAHTLAGGLAHLEGRADDADREFAESLRLAREHTPLPILYSTSGIHYAEHLRRRGDMAGAKRVHETNLRVCVRAGWKADEARCQVGLGDIARLTGDLDTASREYEAAYATARQITRRDTLIHAMLARARTLEDAVVARSELDKALSLARKSGYRILEADIENALAELLRQSDPEQAWEAATAAEQLSDELGYHWGKTDSTEIISTLP